MKNPAELAVFYWLFVGEVSPRNFPWNRPIFLRICPRKSFENWLISAKIPRNGPIFRWILTFLPRKSPEIIRLFREFRLFSRENTTKSVDFSANLPLKIQRNFAFFSAKYQKPWFMVILFSKLRIKLGLKPLEIPDSSADTEGKVHLCTIYVTGQFSFQVKVFQPFKPQYQHNNSPNWSPYISLKM